MVWLQLDGNTAWHLTYVSSSLGHGLVATDELEAGTLTARTSSLGHGLVATLCMRRASRCDVSSHRLGMVWLQRRGSGNFSTMSSVIAWAWFGCNDLKTNRSVSRYHSHRLGMVWLQPYSKSQAYQCLSLKDLLSISGNARVAVRFLCRRFVTTNRRRCVVRFTEQRCTKIGGDRQQECNHLPKR